ncbi:DUF2164 domain-containing protein [Thalassotalea psychrophila]|uniref:DUF2164 domain-containing protein n=1 Tax=Thalassotalea psychrophila TaxID=3065647 RepID=A0ABY9TV54_9GAMM|nr:DUF2164 domain-containing protein [Colwelliaceae bacterium SQ149]
MSTIKFSTAQKDGLVLKLQRYFEAELDQELGQFDAEFLLDFFAKEMGAVYYNQGLYDAQAILNDKVADISDAIYEIEKPTDI